MLSLWRDVEAADWLGDLGQRVYTTRLLGQERSLVLHGGGNTSVKIRERNLVGEEEDILYVKGSGWDLATIETAGFSPVRMARLLALARLSELSDTKMAAELKSNMTDASAPAPSVEAILHAILPNRFVDHTHADALISISNATDGEARVREVYGHDTVIVPYVMPGFKLARRCAGLLPRKVRPGTVGLILMHHGLFSFGDTAQESYERMIELVTRAERYLQHCNAWYIPEVVPEEGPVPTRAEIAKLRRSVCEVLGAPAILSMHRDRDALAFAQHKDVNGQSQQGPATPDHVIRTKRVPMVGRDVAAYRREYEQYFAENRRRYPGGLTMLDPAPRVILDPDLGMVTIGYTVHDARAAEDIYRHTIGIIRRASALGGYQALSPDDIFDVEYWDLEQAKLRKGGEPPSFTGEVVLVTGAASGIGRACVDVFLEGGAAVVALDIDAAITDMFDRPDVCGVQCDVTDEDAVSRAMDRGTLAFGGLDMLILNAGIFPPARPIEKVSMEEWGRIMRINVDANMSLFRLSHPLLALAPRGGRVVVIGSKNVPAPGTGVAGYSASKAALTQLARVAALEWGKDNVRVNVLHPNAVFDTGLWTDEILEDRARRYGLSVEEYKRNNVLGVDVTSRDVARLAAALCGDLFAKTTGAQIPVDGGNERVI